MTTGGLTSATVTLTQALALVNVGGQLIAVGLATALSIRQAFKLLAPGLSDADLNVIVQHTIDDAQRRVRLADAEIAAAEAEIAARG